MAEDTKTAEALSSLTSAVQELSGKLSTHIEVQDERCSNAHTSICNLQETVYGRGGEEGIKTGFTRLSAQAKVVFGLLAAIGTASIGSLVAWIVSIINTGATK